jgi:unsaturated rhamnogalacturonyl hydrolase
MKQRKDERYYEYAKGYADSLIDSEGVIFKYKMDNYNIDQVNPGKMMFLLYDRTKDPRYEKVIHTLRDQLESQPRIAEGGSGTRRFILTRCGLTASTWEHPFMQSMP